MTPMGRQAFLEVEVTAKAAHWYPSRHCASDSHAGAQINWLSPKKVQSVPPGHSRDSPSALHPREQNPPGMSTVPPACF